MTIFQFALIRSLRRKFTLLSLCAVPIAMVFISPLWNSENRMGFGLYGMAILYAAFLLVRSIMSDRQTGTIVRIYAGPVTTSQYLLQNLLAFLLLLLIQIVLIVWLGSMMYGWGLYMTTQFILIYTFFAGTSIAFSLAWNSLFRSKLMSDGMFGVVVSVMSILGGIFVPIYMLPGFLQKIGMLLPTYWLSNALLIIQNKDGYRYDYWLSIVILMLFTAAFLIFGSKRRLE